MDQELSDKLDLIVIDNLPKLLGRLRQPPTKIEKLKIEGNFTLCTHNALISHYEGILAIFRNPNIEGWYSVESFIEDRDQRMPDFIAQFYAVGKWSYPPRDSIASWPTDYIKAPVLLGAVDSSLLAVATFALSDVIG